MKPSSPRGQAMVLWVLSFLLLSLMVFMTLSINARARQRLELQSVADAAAYSNAVATARTFNTISLINRTAISHWVAMLGIQANHTWATAVKSYYNQFAGTVREMEGLNIAAARAARAADPSRCNAPYVRPDEGIPPGDSTGWYECPELYEPTGACSERTRQIRAASYNFWHAALALQNAPGAGADNVRLGCDGVDDPTGATCTISNPRLRDGFGELDRAVAQQSRDVRTAVADISEVGRRLHRELRDTLEDQVFTRRLVRMAQGSNPMSGSLGPFQIERGSSSGNPPPGWREVSRTMGTNPRALESLAHATEGTRGDIFTLGGARTYNDPDLWQPRMQAKVRQIENILNTQFGAGRFRFELVRNSLVTYYHRSEENPELGAGRVSSSAELGWKTAASNNWGKVRVTYNDPCGAPRTVTKTLNAMTYLHAGAPNLDQHLWYTHGTEIRAHGEAEFPSCHLGHRHWGELNNSEHDLGPEVVINGDRQGIYPGGFGFVFPQGGEDGAEGAFGQPKVPTLLTRRTSGPGITPAPWDFTFRFRFNAAGAGTEFDMRKSPAESEMMALSTGIVYYHRRRDRYLADESWRESPNLLNPFWHATLVPIDIDEHGRAIDRTPGGRAPEEARRMLRAAGANEKADAYRLLINRGFKGIQ
jgi:hypothetical protein